jgi:signal transduction histidine kinase/DNA-binding response OmpR family regulator
MSELGSYVELRVSPKLALAVLVFWGVVLVVAGECQPNSLARAQVSDFALAIHVVSAVAWLVLFLWPRAGPGCALGAWIGLILLAAAWFDQPSILALLAIPTALAAGMVGLRGATVVTAVETAALLFWPDAIWGGMDAGVVVPLAGVWMMLGLMAAVYRPVYQAIGWSWEYVERTQGELEQARDRQVTLKQALADLADANAQLTRLNMVAQGLRQAAEDARLAKEQFVANVSHELRTPLNMIVGFSEMIVRTPQMYGASSAPSAVPAGAPSRALAGAPVPQTLLADLMVIYRNAQHLADLIDDVLDLSQIEADQMALSKEAVSFDEIVAAAVIAVRPLFESKGLYLRTTVPEDLTVFCDRTRIREVLLNLLSNAGRFTEQGGVEVHVSQEREDVMVAVSDTGRGIAAQDLGKLFRPFQQIDGSIRRRYGGTGLGLSISKRFIELHGGQIWVNSEVGQGTTFFFRLPMRPAALADGDYSRWLIPEWEYVQRTRRSTAPRAVIRPRLVVVEKGQALRRLLVRYLDGVEVVPATSLQDAVQKLATSPSQALLINELSVNGVLQDIRTVDLPYDTPVMVCSVPEAHPMADLPGMVDYLVKPISRDKLLAALERLEMHGKSVLIVDDEPEALRLFRRMLVSSAQGYRVLRARDGQEALHMLRLHRPDAMLLDLVMPNMDGFQLLEAKSQDPELRGIPVVVISARDPAGQPIVSSTLTVVKEGGLSARHLLAGIKALSDLLSPGGLSVDLVRTAAPAGEPACG